jgi:hypothetical protein
LVHPVLFFASPLLASSRLNGQAARGPLLQFADKFLHRVGKVLFWIATNTRPPFKLPDVEVKNLGKFAFAKITIGNLNRERF